MWSSSLHWHNKWHEKIALREAAKKGAIAGEKGKNGSGDSSKCTCSSACPVHSRKMAVMETKRETLRLVAEGGKASRREKVPK